VTGVAHQTLDEQTVHALAEKFVTFLETNTVPVGLFAPDVFCDFSLPSWRLQTSGADAAVALRTGNHPSTGTVPRWRVDATPTGFVLEIEERWENGQQWYCRELFRADVVEGLVSQLSVYCTGDWDEATQARHAREVRLLRP
jgi:hypothetical protein